MNFIGCDLPDAVEDWPHRGPGSWISDYMRGPGLARSGFAVDDYGEPHVFIAGNGHADALAGTLSYHEARFQAPHALKIVVVEYEA